MSRKRARYDILTSPGFRRMLPHVKKQLVDTRYCLVGGLAVAYHVNPPVTEDMDFLFRGGDAETITLRDRLRQAGWKVSVEAVPTVGPGLPLLVVRGRLVAGSEVWLVDFIPTHGDRFLDQVVARGVPVKFGRTTIPVATAEDLIIMKSLAGREKDMEDIREIESKLWDVLDREYLDEENLKLAEERGRRWKG